MAAIYFPDRPWAFGFKRKRRWSTVVMETPTGQRQARKLWARYRRAASLAVWGEDQAAFTECRETLDLIAGQLNPFFVFMRDTQHFTAFNMLADHDGSAVDIALRRYVIPFKESTVASVKLNGATVSDFAVDAGAGPGGEDKVTFPMGQYPLTGDLITLNVTGRERLLVVKTSDEDSFDYLYPVLNPGVDTLLDVEEQPTLEADVLAGIIIFPGGGAGSAGSSTIYRANLTGTMNDVNMTFTIPGGDSWVAESVWLLRNGQLVNMESFTVGGTGNRTVTTVFAPSSGETLTILGRHAI